MTTPTNRTVDQSWELYDRAVGLIPMATQTGSKAPRTALRGIEPTYKDLPWGDTTPFADAFRRDPKGIAAVSVACAYGEIRKGGVFLSELRELTARHGALLIFDEILFPPSWAEIRDADHPSTRHPLR